MYIGLYTAHVFYVSAQVDVMPHPRMYMYVDICTYTCSRAPVIVEVSVRLHVCRLFRRIYTYDYNSLSACVQSHVHSHVTEACTCAEAFSVSWPTGECVDACTSVCSCSGYTCSDLTSHSIDLSVVLVICWRPAEGSHNCHPVSWTVASNQPP